jgi:hypothetical protein
MITDKITNLKVKEAIDALQAGDPQRWFALFTQDVQLYDDGHKVIFRPFFEEALGHERFTRIDKVEHDSLHIYGHFHSDRWGEFLTYFKFQEGSDGRFNRLEIGQARY